MNNLQPHEERVLDELEELGGKLNKLSVFIKGDGLTSLPDNEQDLLRSQYAAMTAYYKILVQRIGAF